MRLGIILFAVGSLASIVSDSSLVKGQSTAQKEKRPRLMIELIADKTVYRPKDNINLKVMVSNEELSDDVFVFGDMGIGYRSTFILFRRDAKGREVPTRLVPDYKGNPPNLDDPYTFVKLMPGTFVVLTLKPRFTVSTWKSLVSIVFGWNTIVQYPNHR